MIKAIIVGLIVAYFGYALTNKSVELKYTLSEQIPSTFIDNTKEETIQQLIITNSGNKTAENILIKIDASIIDYKINKNSLNDEIKVTKSNSSYEFLYPRLPIDGKVTFIFKTLIVGINDYNLKITHQSGKAVNTTGSNPLDIGNLIFGIISLVYLFFIIRDSFKFFTENLKSKAEYERLNEFLNIKKPFYIPEKDWNKVREKYIQKLQMQSGYWKNIEDEDLFKILNIEQPIFVTKEEWNLLVERAIKVVDEKIKEIIDNPRALEHESLLVLKKPKLFSEQKWKEIKNRIHKNYIEREELRIIRYQLSVDKLVEILKKGKPNELLQEYWDKYEEFVLGLLYNELYREVVKFRTLNLEFLKWLDDERKNKLEEILYKIKLNDIPYIDSLYYAESFEETKKYEWMKDSDYDALLKKANSYISLERKEKELDIQENKNQLFYDNIKYLIDYKTQLGEKPELLADNDWNNLKNFEEKILTRFKQVEKNSIKNNLKKRKNNKLKNKLSKQIKVLNDFFDNPDSINRIEKYDNPFSKGNFKRLQEFSKKL